jgi:hypothetical protein
MVLLHSIRLVTGPRRDFIGRLWRELAKVNDQRLLARLNVVVWRIHCKESYTKLCLLFLFLDFPFLIYSNIM